MTPDLALTYCRMIAQTLGLDQAGLQTLVAGSGVDEDTLQHNDGFIDWPGRYWPDSAGARNRD